MHEAGPENRGTAATLAPLPAIDRAHLTRMTLGDVSLEREVLELFDRQASMLIARIRTVPANAVAALAHTLKGSACGIGAGAVARAAEAVELAAEAGAAGSRRPRRKRSPGRNLVAALDALDVAVGEARAGIADMLRAH